MIHFLLTVHCLTSSNIVVLDTLVNMFLKKWAELPQCATQDIVHSEYGLGISKIEDLYQLCHSLELTNVHLLADPVVNVATDTPLAWESTSLKAKTNSETRA